MIPAAEVARIDRANRAARAGYLETLRLEQQKVAAVSSTLQPMAAARS